MIRKIRMIWPLMVLLVLAGCSSINEGPSDEINQDSTPVSTALPVSFTQPDLTLSDLPAFQETRCPFVLPEDVVQGQNVECGYLWVPEVRGNPETRMIGLAVAIFTPARGIWHPDPIVYLSGGPGGSALEMVRYSFHTNYDSVLDSGRVLILFDQRGVGLSRPALDCPEVEELTLELLDGYNQGRQLSQGEMTLLLVEAFQDCGERLLKEAELSAYNSVASAADIVDLRTALGYAEINLWGASYGSRLALEVMRTHPEGIRSVVLDGVYPPQVNLYLEAPQNFDRALRLLFQRCAENEVCRENHPNLEQIFFEAVDNLNRQPLEGEVENMLTGETFPAQFNGNGLIGLVFQLLYNTDLRYVLPDLIEAAGEGDLDFINRVRGALIAEMGLASRGMMFSVQCHEELPFGSLEAYQEALRPYPQFSEFFDNGVVGKLAYSVCADWPSGFADETADQPVISDLPVLLLSGEMDPITPPDWGELAVESLSNGSHFTFPGEGHGVSFSNACAREIALTFWKDPTAELETVCWEALN